MNYKIISYGENSMKQQKQTYVAIANVSSTPGANLGFVQMLRNINTTLDSLPTNEGLKPKISKIRTTIRLYQDITGFTNLNFMIQPVIVQTAGTFADTVNLTERTISSMLDAAIDDDFGFYKANDLRVSRLGPTNIAGNIACLIETSFDVPPHIIGLLNKESQTERLQSIYTGYTGIAVSNAAVVGFFATEITFTEVRKGITIR